MLANEHIHVTKHTSLSQHVFVSRLPFLHVRSHFESTRASPSPSPGYMTAERPSPHTSGADLRCSDCLLPFPAGIWPRCSDCGYWRCSGCELFLQVGLALDNSRVRGAFRRQMSDALTAYSTRCARAKERSQGPPVSATAPIPTPPPITDEGGQLPTVPSGWEAVYSVGDRAYYYWHIASNHTQWEDPNTTTVAALEHRRTSSVAVAHESMAYQYGQDPDSQPSETPTLDYLAGVLADSGEDISMLRHLSRVVNSQSHAISGDATIGFSEPTTTTGTASIDWAEHSIWGPPPNTVRLPGTSSLPPPAPRSGSSRSSSSSGESLRGRSSSR